MDGVDLAYEMAAARQRREEKTARLLREARAQAIRAAVRPGSSRVDIEEKARSFYPRLSPELLEEAITLACPESREEREARESQARAAREAAEAEAEAGLMPPSA